MMRVLSEIVDKCHPFDKKELSLVAKGQQRPPIFDLVDQNEFIDLILRILRYVP